MVSPGTTTDNHSNPDCDFCTKESPEVFELMGVPGALHKAKYDGATQLGSGSWAYMCQDHFEIHGVGLGTGRGQELV